MLCLVTAQSQGRNPYCSLFFQVKTKPNFAYRIHFSLLKSASTGLAGFYKVQRTGFRRSRGRWWGAKAPVLRYLRRGVPLHLGGLWDAVLKSGPARSGPPALGPGMIGESAQSFRPLEWACFTSHCQNNAPYCKDPQSWPGTRSLVTHCI